MKVIKRVTALALVMALGAAGSVLAQDKVIQKSTDEKGFEQQLTEIDLMHQTAAQLMTAGQYDEAAAELERVVAGDPDRLEAWQDLARCYDKLQQFDKAAGSWMSASKLQPENLDLLSNLGYAQLRAADWDGGTATYKQMLEVDATSYDANVHLGFILQKRAKEIGTDVDRLIIQEKAASYYEKALESKSDDVATMGSLAQLYVEMDQEDKAILMYERGIESAEGDQKKQLQSKLGKSMIYEKNWQKAALVYMDLAAAEPDNPAYEYNAGISLMQAKQHKDAVTYFENTIRLSPDYAQAYQYLATCYNETGRYSQAITTIKKGLQKTDKKAGLYVTWGRSLEKMEAYDEAIEMFERALNDPQYGSYAKKQIQRQEDLKKRSKMMKGG